MSEHFNLFLTRAAMLLRVADARSTKDIGGVVIHQRELSECKLVSSISGRTWEQHPGITC
jgi:hypothetical protein